MNRPTPTCESPLVRAERAPGCPYTTTVLLVELQPGTRSYVDDSGDDPPILVIDAGMTEVHIGVPPAVTLDDLAVLDKLADSILKLRKRLVAHLY